MMIGAGVAGKPSISAIAARKTFRSTAGIRGQPPVRGVLLNERIDLRLSNAGHAEDVFGETTRLGIEIGLGAGAPE